MNKLTYQLNDDDYDSENNNETITADSDVFEEEFLQRGLRLRQLRELERQDEQARNDTAATAALDQQHGGDDAAPFCIKDQQHRQQQHKQDEDDFVVLSYHLPLHQIQTVCGNTSKSQQNSLIESLPSSNTTTTTTTCPTAESASSVKVLSYASYLQTQLYYDDLKHIDYSFIDYGNCCCCLLDNNDDNNESGKKMDEKESDDRSVVRSPSLLIIEQDKTLGKGGICWDAAYILADFLIYVMKTDGWWETTTTRNPTSDSSTTTTTIRMLELGCGTGLCGILVAKAAAAADHMGDNIETDNTEKTTTTTTTTAPLLSVSLTDLPNLMPLIQRNICRNFHCHDTSTIDTSAIKPNEYNEQEQHPAGTTPMIHDNASTNITTVTGQPTGVSLSAFVLDWADAAAAHARSSLVEQGDHHDDNDKDNKNNTTSASLFASSFNVIVGADVVATLYDPTCLAWTIHRMSNINSIVYISFKERLSSIHRQFENIMKQLFAYCEIIHPLLQVPATTTTTVSMHDSDTAKLTPRIHGRRRLHNRNPDVQIFVARHKIENPQIQMEYDERR